MAAEISREDIQSAIAKAVELRALHASLMHQGNSTASLIPPSPGSYLAPQFSAQDYPVFTPSYEDEPLPGYQQMVLENRNYAESWGEYNLNTGNGDETVLSDYRTNNASSRKGLVNLEGHVCPIEDQNSVSGSCAHHMSVLRASPDFSKSRRYSLGDINTLSSCNKCKPAIVSIDDGLTKNSKKSNIVVPLTDSHSSLHSQPRTKGLNFSWLFPKNKKKNKNESSPLHHHSDEGSSRMLKNSGVLSIETLKKELMEAQESRDAAVVEVSEMKLSMGDLSQKMEYLETYCDELKQALRQAVEVQNSQPEKLINLPKRGNSIDSSAENSMPVSDEVMVEGFLQIVSEARLSVKQFCKTLVGIITETDQTLLDNLNSILQPYKLSLNSKYSKAVLYHLEAIINQSLYEFFENCAFQKHGAPKHLDPHQERQARFQSYVALRNLSWNEVLRKGTKYYSEEFSKFCDQKMSGIIATIGWSKPWPEQLLQAFFVAAKCIWLLHLLAFSFNPVLGILRVEENRHFEAEYMDDILVDRKRSQVVSRVKIMVMPGFYVHDRVLKCKVLCRYKSIA